MSRIRLWQQARRMWLSIGSDLIRTMIGLVLFTVVSVFVVLGYSWMIYYQSVYDYTSKVLSKQFQIPSRQIKAVLREAEVEVGNQMGFDVLNERDKYLLAALIFLTFLLPSLLAWWSSKRFARPLTQLSKAARLITTGDFSTRIALSKSLERREDETALLLKDFNSMAMSLERFERERRYGLAAIAHELRTPVTVLRGRLEGVRDGVLVADSPELEKLLGHAKMLSQLIEDLQLVSLAEAGELRLNCADFMMQDLLKQIYGDYLVKTQQIGLELKLVLPTQDVWYYGDQQRLYQVLSNLINNALRHTPKDGWIELRLLVQSESLRLEVQDSGAGFTHEAMDRAFERFYRSVDRGRKQGGSGLGLAISRSLIEAHGGQIELIPVEVGAFLRVRLEKDFELKH